jgi:hypothetical protein
MRAPRLVLLTNLLAALLAGAVYQAACNVTIQLAQ